MSLRNRTIRPEGTGDAILQADPRWQIATRIAGSPTLSRASQLREILLYVVRQAVLDPEASIHESEIAHRVLGRRKDFNPLDDNIVRVQMAHLRKKLELYYSTEGKDEPIVLTIALGSYKPIFTQRVKKQDSARSAAESIPSAELPQIAEAQAGTQQSGPFHALAALAADRTTKPGRFRNFAAAAVLLLLCMVIALSTGLYLQQKTIDNLKIALTPWRAQPAVAAFWAPFFASSHDTDLVLGDNSLLLIEQINRQYTTFDGYVSRSYLADLQNPQLSSNDRFVLNLIASKSLGSNSEFKLAQRVMAQDPQNKRIHLYAARQYVPTLLKQNNIILIGGRISNPWQGVFNGRLTFSEGMKFIDLGVSSVVNRAPKPGERPEYVSSDSVGWCAIAYLPNPSQDTAVLLLEGTGSEATEAAGDFLFSQEQLSALLKKFGTSSFPPFEVLLKISQVKGTPLTATIEAYRTYPVSN